MRAQGMVSDSSDGGRNSTCHARMGCLASLLCVLDEMLLLQLQGRGDRYGWCGHGRTTINRAIGRGAAGAAMAVPQFSGP